MYKVFKNSQITYEKNLPYHVSCGDKESGSSTYGIVDEEKLERLLNLKFNNIKDKAEEYAEGILYEAKEKANQILRQAEVDADRIYNEQKEEGLDQGLRAANEKCKNVLQALNEFEVKLKGSYDSVIDEIKNSALELALTISEKILAKEIEEDSTIVLNIVNNVMKKFKDEKNVVVELSAETVEKLKELESDADYTIRADSSLDDGDVKINCNYGTVDASVKGQFENLKNSLLKEKI